MRKVVFTISTPLLALSLVAECNRDQVSAASSDPSPAAGQDSEARAIQIRMSSSQRSYACHNSGDSVQVTGNSNILTISGNCGSLQVTGRSNAITIDSVQSVQFTGDSNSVLYRSAHRPTVSDDGQSNSLARATGGVTARQGSTVTSSDSSQSGGVTVNGTSTDAIVSNALQAANSASQAAAATAGMVKGVQTNGDTLNIILSKQQTTANCGQGRLANINGYQNDITLTGSCSKVVLNGWGNTLHIEEVAAIEVMGHTNTIYWQRGRNTSKPRVQIDSGMNNSVQHEQPASQ